MVRPGGNPEITKYSFKPIYDWGEPCKEKMTLMLPLSLKAAIKEGKIKNWQEIARQAIAANIKEKPRK